MQAKDAIAKLVRLYTEEESISEQVKEIKDEAKAAGHDATVLAAVAKAIVKNKVDDLVEKSNAMLAAVDISRS